MLTSILFGAATITSSISLILEGCITAISVYGITKNVLDGKTKTSISLLNEQQEIEELARILGGAEITENSSRKHWTGIPYFRHQPGRYLRSSDLAENKRILRWEYAYEQ